MNRVMFGLGLMAALTLASAASAAQKEESEKSGKKVVASTTVNIIPRARRSWNRCRALERGPRSGSSTTARRTEPQEDRRAHERAGHRREGLLKIEDRLTVGAPRAERPAHRSDGRRRPRPAGWRLRRPSVWILGARGYTIVEALFVVALAVTLVSIAVPATLEGLEETRTRSAARLLAGRIRLARAMAAARSKMIGLRFERVDEDMPSASTKTGIVMGFGRSTSRTEPIASSSRSRA